ncbi:MAG TPA: hypothetical protein VK718_04750 [Ferruginibacter sp.]|nr:hypothetical protein [Ferruginibacter sp.]
MRIIYHVFYRLLPIRKVNAGSELFILTKDEIKTIRRKERIAIWLAAFFGTMGVILLYVPQYAFPHLFPSYTIVVFNKPYAIPVIMMLYSFVLVMIEITLLTFLNIWCAHEVAVATGFLTHENKQSTHKRNLLVDIGLEKKNKQELKYGIDPLQGINKTALLTWNFFFILKATLSNMLFKVLIQRMLGRYALQAVKDFAGIPIFAAWNAYGTKVILKEARVVIMGQNLIEQVAVKIRKDQAPTAEFKNLLYDTMQYIAINKRDFHQNHFVLTKMLFTIYKIQPKETHFLETGYLERLKTANEEERKICELLIVIGFLLDGSISIRETIQIRELNKQGLLDLDIETIKQYERDFLNGKGIAGLISKYL